MIFIAAFEISGIYNGSDVERGLRNLQQQINSLKAPKITPQMGNADLGAFFNAMDTGGFKTAGTKAGSVFTDGLKKSLSGNMETAGRDAGMLFQNSMASSFGPGGGMLASMATALGPAGLVAGAAVAGAAVIGAAAVSAAKQWETLMSGVAKTTGVTGDELSKLSDTLLKLSTEIPVAQADIARIAATGGTLGIKQADLARFVTDVSMASVGWQMDAESTAQSIAGISNAFKVPIADAQKFGSVINTMADEVGGSEKEIVDFLIRASGIAVTFDESIASTAAFGAVLASINMPMEVAATGLQSMMAYAMADPKRMTAWADMMGISVDRLKAKLEEDLYTTIIESADMIKTVGSETEQQAKRIALWGEGGARLSSGLVGMSEKYEDAQRKANNEMENGISLLSAFGEQGSTLDAKFTRFGNAMNMAFIHLGTSALPVIGDITDAITDMIIKIDSIGQKTAAAGGYIQSKLAEVQANPLLNSVVAGPASLLGLDASQIASSGAYHAASSIALGPLASLLWGTKKTAVVASESVASTGTQDGATYITALKGVLDTGIPKSVSDAYLKGVSAPAKAGQEAAQNFIEAQDAYIKAHPGGMSVSNLYDTGEKSPITGKTIYKEGTPRIIGGSDESKHKYEGLWGRGSGTIVADEEGIKYKISYSTDKFGTTSYLYIDGQLMGETREASSKEAAIQDLFSQASARDKLTKTLSLKLQGRGGEAALITETVDVELDFDVDVATKNANQSLKKFSESQNWGEYLFGDKENTVLGELEWASNIGDDVAKSAVDDIGTALQEVSLENYPKIVAGVEALNRELGDMWGGFGPRSDVYTKLQSQYADAILAGVIDAKDLLKAQSTETTNLLADSLSDGYITGSEKGALEARKTLLGLLKERYPVEFKAAGLDKIASDIQATLDGRAFSIDVKPEVEFVANFALWKKDNAALYEKIYATTGQIPTSSVQEERYKYEQALAEEGSKRSQSILRWLEEFDSALESNDVSSLVPIYETLLDYDPDLANQKWFTQLGETGTILSQKMMTAGDSAETLGGKFLDVASTMEAVNGRLMSLLSEARGIAGMASWKQTVSQVNSSGRRLDVPASLTAAKTDTGYKISQFPGKLNIPKLAEGGKVTQGGLAWIGEAGPEIVIPEEDIKGLYPQSANVDKGSMSYLTSGRYFEDYPYEIHSESYKRGSFPNAPPVLTTGDMPVSWLSDQQTTGNEWISGEIRAAQLAAMGLTEENVLKTPKVAQALTNRDVWNAIYDNDGTCIAFVEPDPSLNFTPGADYMPGGKRWGNLDLPLGSYYGGSSSFYGGGVAATTPGGWLSGKSSTPVTSAITAPSDALVMPGGINTSDALTRRTAWNAIYDNNGTCIAFVEPDPSLNFTPGIDYLPGGKGLGNMGGGYTSLGDREISTWDSVAESTRDTATATEKVVENTRQNLIQTQRVADGLVMASSGYGGYGGYGGSGILGLANRGGGTYWGGTSISGGGSWIAASPGPASGSSTAAWMNEGARSVGGSNAVQWAEGGITDHPVFGVFGEAGREAFVPISDRAAGLRILPQVMRELGIATFADGGIVQSQSITGSGAVSSTLGQTIVNGVATSQYATHSGGEPTVATGDINLTIQGDVGRTQLRDMIAQLRQEWKEERNNLVRILKQSRTGGHY